MTSKERHEARFQRRVTSRNNKKNAKISRIGEYDDIFSYDRFFGAFYLCRKGVRWKASIQSYEALLPLSTLTIYNVMHDRRFKPMGFLEFDIMERGKKRHIRALKIDERCIQRTLCDNYLEPLFESQLIYDNGASQKGKGTDFVLRRLKYFLLHYYRIYHTNEGYVLQFDFSSYFDNINHEILLKQAEKIIPDKEIYEVFKQMIECFGDKGLGLGSQVSQIAAIYYPTPLDRYFKETMHIKGYCRYMDDGIIICHTLDEVNKCKEALYRLCEELDIKINEKKLTVSKLSKTFVFLKKRIRLTETGGVIMKISKDSVVRARRKLKKLANKALDPNEKFTYVDLCQSYKSWIGSAKRYDNYFVVQNFRKLFLTATSRINRIEQLQEFERNVTNT